MTISITGLKPGIPSQNLSNELKSTLDTLKSLFSLQPSAGFNIYEENKLTSAIKSSEKTSSSLKQYSAFLKQHSTFQIDPVNFDTSKITELRDATQKFLNSLTNRNINIAEARSALLLSIKAFDTELKSATKEITELRSFINDFYNKEEALLAINTIETAYERFAKLNRFSESFSNFINALEGSAAYQAQVGTKLTVFQKAFIDEITGAEESNLFFGIEENINRSLTKLNNSVRAIASNLNEGTGFRDTESAEVQLSFFELAANNLKTSLSEIMGFYEARDLKKVTNRKVYKEQLKLAKRSIQALSESSKKLEQASSKTSLKESLNKVQNLLLTLNNNINNAETTEKRSPTNKDVSSERKEKALNILAGSNKQIALINKLISELRSDLKKDNSKAAPPLEPQKAKAPDTDNGDDTPLLKTYTKSILEGLTELKSIDSQSSASILEPLSAELRFLSNTLNTYRVNLQMLEVLQASPESKRAIQNSRHEIRAFMDACTSLSNKLKPIFKAALLGGDIKDLLTGLEPEISKITELDNYPLLKKLKAAQNNNQSTALVNTAQTAVPVEPVLKQAPTKAAAASQSKLQTILDKIYVDPSNQFTRRSLKQAEGRHFRFFYQRPLTGLKVPEDLKDFKAKFRQFNKLTALQSLGQEDSSALNAFMKQNLDELALAAIKDLTINTTEVATKIHTKLAQEFLAFADLMKEVYPEEFAALKVKPREISKTLSDKYQALVADLNELYKENTEAFAYSSLDVRNATLGLIRFTFALANHLSYNPLDKSPENLSLLGRAINLLAFLESANSYQAKNLFENLSISFKDTLGYLASHNEYEKCLSLGSVDGYYRISEQANNRLRMSFRLAPVTQTLNKLKRSLATANRLDDYDSIIDFAKRPLKLWLKEITERGPTSLEVFDADYLLKALLTNEHKRYETAPDYLREILKEEAPSFNRADYYSILNDIFFDYNNYLKEQLSRLEQGQDIELPEAFFEAKSGNGSGNILDLLNELNIESPPEITEDSKVINRVDELLEQIENYATAENKNKLLENCRDFIMSNLRSENNHILLRTKRLALYYLKITGHKIDGLRNDDLQHKVKTSTPRENSAENDATSAPDVKTIFKDFE